MKKLLIQIAVVFSFVVICGIVFKCQRTKIVQLNSENKRLSDNNYQLFTQKQQETTLYLKERELSKVLHRERDSLAKSLLIRPKQVLVIKTEIQTIHDTVIKPVQVLVYGQNFWKISDKDKCWLWEADALLKNDSLQVNRTNFDYHNKMTEVYYKKAPHIWFIRTGKWKFFTQKSMECGNISTEEFHFVK
jgi:hypothetical protein